jgi:hypothetical protein
LKPAWAKSSQDIGLFSTNKTVVACACHPSYTESINRRIAVQAHLSIKGIKVRLHSKRTKAKRTRHMAQVAQHMSKQAQALSSNLSTKQKKRYKVLNVIPRQFDSKNNKETLEAFSAK